MQPDHDHPRYVPTSVGGLMDPTFLRDAVSDADGTRRQEAVSMRQAWYRLRTAALAWRAAAVRRQPEDL